MSIAKVLSIAGLDSSGGAGISADIKTFTALKVYGASIVTAITAQNTKKITGVFPLPPTILSAQLETTLKDIKFDAVKTGMLTNGKLIEIVVQKLKKYKVKNIVIDPVMISTEGTALLKPSAIKILVKKLFPIATLVTPNIAEVQKLVGIKIKNIDDIKLACKKIKKLGAKNVLIKGGHLNSEICVDTLYAKNKFYSFSCLKVKTKNTHGTGCTLSAAITAYLAKGEKIDAAVGKAKQYITGAIKKSLKIGLGIGPLNHFWNIK